jgi:cellobiose transport system substrate-binding protein
MQQAITRVEDGLMSADESWAQFETDVNSLG